MGSVGDAYDNAMCESFFATLEGAGAPLIEKVRFAEDSPLEGDGFEPSVPRSRERTSGAKSDLQEDNRRRRVRQAE
jgi:hypothetical protein